MRHYNTESVAASHKPLGTGVLGLSGLVSAEDRLWQATSKNRREFETVLEQSRVYTRTSSN